MIFTLGNNQHKQPTLTAENVLGEVVVTALGLKVGSARKNKGPALLVSDLDGSYSARGNSDEEISAGLTQALEEQDWKGTRAFINEAIVRKPYLPKFYQLRIMVNSKLGDKERVMEDVMKTQNFMNGKSLQIIIEGK